jgi:histidinol-phosphatase
VTAPSTPGPDRYCASIDADLALALELADAADALTMSRFRADDLRVSTKPDTSHVTEADHATEELIRGALHAARPGDAVVGEEFGDSGSEGSTRRWILDPIDGTASYVRGVPIWATLIALEVEGELRVGVVSAPALHTRWFAARGEGAYANERPITVSAVHELRDAQVCYSDIASWSKYRTSETPMLELLHSVWRSRGVGDFWQHMLVAEGAADVAAEPVVNLWDLAPLLVIVEEAGGRFTNLEGERTAGGGSALSTNGLLHDEVLARLAPARARSER